MFDKLRFKKDLEALEKNIVDDFERLRRINALISRYMDIYRQRPGVR